LSVHTAKQKKSVFSEAEPEPIINLEKLSQSNSIPKLSQLAVVDSAVWGIISIGGGQHGRTVLFVVTLQFPGYNAPMEGVKLRKLKPGKKQYILRK
jgi:hypothetical protein